MGGRQQRGGAAAAAAAASGACTAGGSGAPIAPGTVLSSSQELVARPPLAARPRGEAPAARGSHCLRLRVAEQLHCFSSPSDTRWRGTVQLGGGWLGQRRRMWPHRCQEVAAAITCAHQHCSSPQPAGGSDGSGWAPSARPSCGRNGTLSSTARSLGSRTHGPLHTMLPAAAAATAAACRHLPGTQLTTSMPSCCSGFWGEQLEQQQPCRPRRRRR